MKQSSFTDSASYKGKLYVLLASFRYCNTADALWYSYKEVLFLVILFCRAAKDAAAFSWCKTESSSYHEASSIVHAPTRVPVLMFMLLVDHRPRDMTQLHYVALFYALYFISCLNCVLLDMEACLYLME